MLRTICILALAMFLFACSEARSITPKVVKRQVAPPEQVVTKTDSDRFVIVNRDHGGTYWLPRCFEEPYQRVVGILAIEVKAKPFINQHIIDSVMIDMTEHDVVTKREADNRQQYCKLDIKVYTLNGPVLIPIQFHLSAAADEESYILTVFNTKAIIDKIAQR